MRDLIERNCSTKVSLYPGRYIARLKRTPNTLLECENIHFINPNSPTPKCLINRLSYERYFSRKIIREIAEDLVEIARQGSVSHLVIYGRNRFKVLASMLHHAIEEINFPIILSEKELAKELLIADRLENQLSTEEIATLPDVLDSSRRATLGMIPPRLIDRLYRHGRLIQPYHVDSDRYPFCNKLL